jgi:WD40 repeat protein
MGTILVVLAGWLSALPLFAQAPPATFQPRRLAFAPDGKTLVVGGQIDKKGMVVLIDRTTNTFPWRIALQSRVTAVAWSNDGQVLVVASGAWVRLLDPQTGKEIRQIGPHQKEVRSLALSPDGSLLATGGEDRIIRLWRTADGQQEKEWKGHQSWITSLAFAPDGRTLLSTGGKEGRLWDLKEDKARHTFRHGGFLVRCGVFQGQGQVVVTGGWDGSVRMWDAESGEQRGAWENFGGVDGLVLHQDTHTLALRGTGRQIGLLSLNLGPADEKTKKTIDKLLKTLDDNRYAVREEATRELLSLGYVILPRIQQAQQESSSPEVRVRARLILQELKDKKPRLLLGHRGAVRDLALSPDGQTLASAAADGTVREWDVKTGKEKITRLGAKAGDK